MIDSVVVGGAVFSLLASVPVVGTCRAVPRLGGRSPALPVVSLVVDDYPFLCPRSLCLSWQTRRSALQSLPPAKTHAGIISILRGLIPMIR